MTQTLAGQRYNNHIKESLLAGKPIEMSMNDFLPAKQSKRKAAQKKQDQTEYKMTIEEVLSYCQRMYSIWDDEQKKAEREGNKKKAFENWQAGSTYDILICKITGKEYVCRIPDFPG